MGNFCRQSNRILLLFQSHDPIDVKWNRQGDRGEEPLPSGFSVEPNRLVLQRASPNITGVYQVVVSNQYGADRQELRINVERRNRTRDQQAQAQTPHIRFTQSQYQVGYGEVIDISPTISVTNKFHE